MEGSGSGLIMVLLRYLPGGTEEDHNDNVRLNDRW
jgi:hypothetical protein